MKINSFTRVSVVLFIVLLCHRTLLAEEISLSKKGGVYELPVEISGVLTLNFVLDSGASEVLIPADVVLTLIRTGTIKDTDFLPGQTYVLADGSTVKSPRFILPQPEGRELPHHKRSCEHWDPHERPSAGTELPGKTRHMGD